MPTSRQAVPITAGSGTNIATVLPGANAGAGDQQIISIGDPDNGNQQAAVSAGGALKVDGSAATQPVSGTITANAGTNLNTSALALEAGGHLATVDTSTAAVNTAVGAQADAAVTTAAAGSLMGYLRALKEAFLARIPTLGQKAKAGALPISFASDQVGAAGTAAADVLTVQGIASMTALKTDGSAVTQPVSGTVTANAGTGTFSIGTPAAAALSDALGNPTTVQIGANVLLWDTTQWVRGEVVPTGASNTPYKGVQATGVMTNYTGHAGWTLAGTSMTHTTPATADQVLANSNDSGTKRRFLYVKWTGNQAIHIVFFIASGAGNAVGTVFGFDLPINAGNVNAQTFLISSDGAFANDANTTVNALTSGSFKALDVPGVTISVRAYAATTPASGTLSIDGVVQS